MYSPQDADDAPYTITHGTSELLDPNSLLSPYLPNRNVYHCPADNYIDPYAGGKVHCRSYSMNSAVGTIYNSATVMADGGTDTRPVGSPVGGGWLPGSGYNANQGAWRVYGKSSSFTQPGPANTWVIIDENPRITIDGSMAISAYAATGHTYLIDQPTGLHGEAGGLAFADGHAIVHKWQDPRTYTVTILDGNAQQNSNAEIRMTRTASIWLQSP